MSETKKKKHRFKIDELLRLACIYAEKDRDGWIQSCRGCRNDPTYKEAIEEAEAFVEQVRAYRRKKWGQTRGEVFDATAKVLTLQSTVQGMVFKEAAHD